MTNTTIGDSMNESRNRALKSLAIFASVLVYVAMLGYTAVHNYSLMTRGIPSDLLLWALAGVVALEISAAALPIALHFWTHSALQRIVAFTFYGIDLGILWVNVILDFAIVANGATTLPGWLELFLFWIVPATPLIAGGAWSLLWILDPSQRELATVEALRSSTRDVLASRIAEQAKQADISAAVDDAADQMARAIVISTLGMSMRSAPAPTNGHKKAVAVYELETERPNAGEGSGP